MSLLAVPYRPQTANPDADWTRNQAILDGVAANVQMFAAPYALADRRRYVAETLLDPTSRAWEVWRGDTLVGLLLLTQVVPGEEAMAHFAFFDGQLWGKRALVRSALRHVFADLGLSRVRCHIPADRLPLVRWTTKLGFHVEGRRSRHDGTAWHDEVCLTIDRADMAA